MKLTTKLTTLGHYFTLAAVITWSTVASAASPKSAGKIKVHDKVIGLFEGMEAGDLNVRFIAKNASDGKILIENKTDQPITIQMPSAFAAVPADFQFGGGGGGGGFGGGGQGGGGGGFGGGGQGGGQGGGGGQGVGGGGGGGQGGGGGGFGGGGQGGGGGGGFGGGGGLFNVDPEKTRRIEVKTVCLEHGKPDPTAKMEYIMVPIEKVTQNVQLMEICRMVGSGEIPQNAGQAAAWHITDRLSWQELAHKDRFRSQFTGEVRKFFSTRELQFASQVVEEAANRAERFQEMAKSQKKTNSPGDNQKELPKVN
jgi:hypothetical protein